jgi:hypothetical protein
MECGNMGSAASNDDPTTQTVPVLSMPNGDMVAPGQSGSAVCFACAAPSA